MLSSTTSFAIVASWVVALTAASTNPASAQPAPETATEIVIAHRGASGYLPEHTLEAYALAHGQGADFVEPDLVLTRDGVFICLHDVKLQATTDVEEVFPERRRKDGSWYAADLSLEEVKRLRTHERLGNRFPRGAADFSVPTFEEMIELVQGLNATTGRAVGIYPELKAPAWHREQGLPMEDAFLEIVGGYAYRGRNAKIFVQSFEPEPLERMRALGSELPQVMLIGAESRYDWMATKEGLDRIVRFANGIGPAKSRMKDEPEIVTWAHERGLVVHPYTLRADQVPASYKTFDEELEELLDDHGVDGVFTDHPDRVRRFLLDR